MKTLEYKVKLCNNLPGWDEMKEGIIYYSKNFNASKHLCPCGCGLATYLPYNVSENHEGGSAEPRTITWHPFEEVLSINPSIQVLGGCNSHYYIKENKVI